MTQIKDKAEIKPFPVKEVSACLLGELTSLAESELAFQDVPPPATPRCDPHDKDPSGFPDGRRRHPGAGRHSRVRAEEYR